ncbi:glycosyltransferase family 2 protein [Natronoflexus pectinivorans]|uniref:GT2 family glycosyltransferase n=1 Tax=Natronoflexus pectinivorans TaxID=682526 RepID=A0A4R2GFH2_9BACT|nr:glycosyltransferase [Natronoflexus pectinivorans]TCO06896.1 GT2 family glycosyltransferase [Natronoflexus pectinivorans]
MISIIIPSYNSAHMVCDTIESVLNSKEENYEIILVNDGSTDNTAEVLSPYFSNKRLKYIEHENKGLAGARNTGILNAKGEYLVFLDADDLILPDKLTVQQKYLDVNPSIDIVYSNSEWFIEDNFDNTRDVSFPVYTGNVIEYLIYGNFIHVNSVMVRKDAVVNAGLFDETLRELEDWDLWLRMALNGSKFGFTPGVLSKVRIRKGSMTSNQMRMNVTMVRVLEKTIIMLELKNFKNSILVKANHALFIYRLKTKQNKNYIQDLIKTNYKIGISFSWIMLKMSLKYFLLPLLPDRDQTVQQLEEIWNR